MSMLLRRYHDGAEDVTITVEEPENGPVLEEDRFKDGSENGGETGGEKPSGNASRDEWEAYALANGKTAEDLDGLKRDEIRDLFKDADEEEA